MKRLFARVDRDQKGITGLETAIILIAFVVVAAVFAYTILSSGLFASQKSKQAIDSGLKQSQSTLDLKGSVSAAWRDASKVGSISFTLGNVVTGGDLVDLTPPYTYDSGAQTLASSGLKNRLQISFTDSKVSVPDAAWTLAWVGKHDNQYLLGEQEQAVITVWLHSITTTTWADGASPPFIGANYLTAGDTFTIEVKPETGAVLTIERKLPQVLTASMDLH